MSIFDNSAQGKQGKGLSLSDLPFNIFNGQNVDRTSWSWLNLIGQKPSQSSAGIEGVSKLAPKYNYLYNGHWHIDQVNEGAPYTVVNGGTTHAMDGISIYKTGGGAGIFTVERATHPTYASKKCCKIICTVADAAIAGTDHFDILWLIEGSKVTNLKSGLASAKTVTFKFEFQTNVLGVYGVFVRNSYVNRVYATTITVIDAAMHEYSVVIPLDITGTWLYANGTIGLGVNLVLATVATGTTETWSANDVRSSASQCNFMSSTSNVAYIGDHQLVEGTVAGDIMPQSAEESLRKCQRFFEKSYSHGIAVPTNNSTSGLAIAKCFFNQSGAATVERGLYIRFTVPKAIPNSLMTAYSYVNSTSGSWEDGGGNLKAMVFQSTGNSSTEIYNNTTVATNTVLSGHWTADCRLL